MSTTTTYANGQVLTSSALTQVAIDKIIQQITLDMLGLPVNSTTNAVRVEYPIQGAPFQNGPTEDFCYLRCMMGADPYDLVRDEIATANIDGSVTENIAYNRTWTIHWTFYGPNCTDQARKVRDAVYFEYFTDQLANTQLFPVSDFAEPVRVPELIDGQWFDRCDFECTIYEFVTATITDQTVLTAEVIGNDYTGVIFDVNP